MAGFLDIRRELEESIELALQQGVQEDRIIIDQEDPGGTTLVVQDFGGAAAERLAG